jgi:protein-L-isoaspartate(D-aspartate) O-methyltransferase
MEQSNVQARFNMVEQQVRPWDVLAPRVLEVMGRIPREPFVPDAYRGLAYADTEVPLGSGRTMLPPRLVGRMLQALDPQPGERALVTGVGSGYVIACMAALAGPVAGLDPDPALLEAARIRLDGAGVRASLYQGNPGDGAPAGPYDVIAVTGSVPAEEALAGLRQVLAVGGRMFLVAGEAPLMEALLLSRVGTDGWRREVLLETLLPPLPGVAPRQAFVF